MIYPVYQFVENPQSRYTEVSNIHSREKIEIGDIVLFVSVAEYGQDHEHSNLDGHYIVVLSRYGLREIDSFALKFFAARLIA